MPDKIWSLGDDGMPPDNNPMWSALAKEAVNDMQSVSRPEDPRIQQEADRHDAVSPADFAQLKEAICDFVKREYDDELTEEAFDNLSCIGIAETTAEDREDIVIDMAVNLEDMTLDQYINGDKMDSWHYSDINSLIGEIKHISFDELVSLGPNAERRVDQLITQFPDEHDFIRNPEDGFAIYQLKSGPEYHELRFACMSELRREAQQMRDDVHHAVERGEDTLFASKAAAEQFLRDEGFTVIPNADPAFITVLNPARIESTVYLTYGNDCCFIDGCDTSAVDQMVRKAHYSQVYSGPIPDECLGMQSTDAILESLYTKFNLDRPADFHGHSLSVSDVIVLKQEGQITSYYTDSFGFEKLPGFLSQDNPLRNAEMSIEDDYGMIDGIINNGSKEDRVTLPDKADAKSEIAPKTDKARPKNEPER